MSKKKGKVYNLSKMVMERQIFLRYDNYIKYIGDPSGIYKSLSYKRDSLKNYRNTFLSSLGVNDKQIKNLYNLNNAQQIHKNTANAVIEGVKNAVFDYFKNDLQAKAVKQTLSNVHQIAKNKLSVTAIKNTKTTTPAIRKFLGGVAEILSAVSGLSQQQGLALGYTILFNNSSYNGKGRLPSPDKVASNIKSFLKQNGIATQGDIARAKRALESLANSLEKAGSNWDNILYKKDFEGKITNEKTAMIFSNIFASTNIAEILGVNIFNATRMTVDELFENVVGGKQFKSNLNGNQAQGKTDGIVYVQANKDVINNKVTYSLTPTPNGDNVKLKIGISMKFQTQQAYANPKLQRFPSEINLGQNGSLGTALTYIIANNVALMKAYNTMNGVMLGNNVLGGEALIDMITRRMLFSHSVSRDSNLDFSSFVFVNGQLFSQWDIFQLIFKYKGILGYTSSTSQGRKQPLALSIDKSGRDEIKDMYYKRLDSYYEKLDQKFFSDINAAYQNSKEVVKCINKSPYSLKLYLRNVETLAKLAKNTNWQTS